MGAGVWVGAIALAAAGGVLAAVDTYVRGGLGGTQTQSANTPVPGATDKLGVKEADKPKPADAPKADKHSAANPSAGPVDLSHLGEKISLEQASALYDQGKLFVDAREPREFVEGHIPNSFNLPPDAFTNGSKDWNQFFQTYAKDELIVVYCGGGDCHASESVASFMKTAGFSNVHIFEAGFPGWQEAKKEVEK